MTLNRRDEPVNSKPALRAFIKKSKVAACHCLKRARWCAACAFLGYELGL